MWYNNGGPNLNQRNYDERLRLNQLCHNGQVESVLNEPTTKNYNQVDHILADKQMKGKLFTTSLRK